MKTATFTFFSRTSQEAVPNRTGPLTGTVHLVDFSEKISQGLALRLPSEWVPNKPKLTPRSFGRKNANLIRFHKSYNYHRGVTMLEIMVVVGIITMMSALVYAPLNDFRAQKTLDASVERTLAAFSQAHLDTISSKNNNQHGVHIAAGEVVYFIGPTYATGTATNIVFTLHPAIEILNISLNGGGSDVLYERLKGSTDQYGTFELRPKGRTTTTATITVNKTGATSI